MGGLEGRTSRWKHDDKPKMAADRAATVLVEKIEFHGLSEREACALAGIAKSTWRRATGRPFPSQIKEGRQGVVSSMLTLRDFIAMAIELNLDPTEVLRKCIYEVGIDAR